jgi:hypothetical protein
MNGVTCFAINLGSGGFCTEMMRVLPAGTLVKGTILLDGQDRSFTGRVAWARRGDFRMNLTGRMGVEFLEVDPELRRTLAARETRISAGGGPGGPTE